MPQRLWRFKIFLARSRLPHALSRGPPNLQAGHDMRIALIMSHADRSMTGAMRELNFAAHLRRLGADALLFRIFPGKGEERERYLGGGAETVFCPEDDATVTVPHRKTSAAMVSALRAFGPEVVIFKGLSYDINAFVADALGAEARYGFIVGGSIKDRVLDRAEFVFGEYEEQMGRHFPAFQAAGTGFVMPKFVDLEATRPEALEPAHDIVNVGNFYEARKNQKDLLPFTRDWRIAMVGGGNPPEALRAGILNPANVTFPGRIDHAALFPLLKRSRIMVHTSTMDGLPRAMVEGMACGLPVVAYRDTVYGGLTDGVEGFLVEREALAGTVHRLLADAALRQEIGRNARALVERRHGIPAIQKAAAGFLDYLRQAPGLRARG